MISCRQRLEQPDRLQAASVTVNSQPARARPQAARGLDPAEALLEPLAEALARGVAGVARGPTAECRLAGFCATCGVTFRARRSATKPASNTVSRIFDQSELSRWREVGRTVRELVAFFIVESVPSPPRLGTASPRT